MRVRLPVAVLSLTVAAGAAGAQQSPAPAAPASAAPSDCTYDTCALRRERVFFSERILAGARGTVVARPRFFGTFPIDSIVRGVPGAEADARVYRREQLRGQVLALVGTVLSAVAVIDAVNRADGSCVIVAPVASCDNRGWRARNSALVLGGVSFNVLGAWRFQIADRRLNRAVWWYNRGLAR